MDFSGEPARRPPGWTPLVSAGLLLANLVLIGLLLFSPAQIRRRLDKLEAGAEDRARPVPGSSIGELPTAAGRQERIALLLAAATDAESIRPLLENMPPGERVEIARALIGRPAGNDRNAALGALLQKITADNPAQAVTLLAGVPDAGLQQSFAAEVAASWIERDPAGGAAWLTGSGQPYLTRMVFHRLLASAVARWSTFDPAAATHFIATQAPGDGADAPELRTASREWASKDSAAALSWAQSLPSNDPRKPLATYGVLEGWADLDPAAAAGYVGQNARSTSRSDAGEAGVVAARWAARDPMAAAQWAGGLADPRARRDALQQVAASWAAVDVPSAARWAATLPAGPERTEIWRGIGEGWADTDQAGTENWLSTLPAGGDRDVAVAAYAARIVTADPVKALTWAKTLSNGPFAARQIQDLLAMWSRKDALSAQNWAVANPISPAPADSGR